MSDIGGSPAGRTIRRAEAWSKEIWQGVPDGGAAVDAAGRLLRAAMPIAALSAVVQAVVHLVNVLGYDGRAEMLNADIDGGVFTWASSAATFSAAFGAMMLAILVRSRRAALGFLAAVLCLFSMDDAVALHERISIGAIGPIEHGGRLLWPLVTMPLLAAAFLMLLGVAVAAPPSVRTALGVALALLVAAVALEVTSPLIFEAGSDHGEGLYEAEVAVEEGLELSAWLLASGALGAGAMLVSARRDPAHP